MFVRDLFEQVLIAPEQQLGCSELLIVSGYVVAAMYQRQILGLAGDDNVPKSLKSIRAIYGMAGVDGVNSSNHISLQRLAKEGVRGVEAKCFYPVRPLRIHSKVYCWMRDGEPVVAFAGSANYTQRAFSPTQHEVLVECDARDAFNYYTSLLAHSIHCIDDEFCDHVVLHDDVGRVRGRNGPSSESDAKNQGISIDPAHIVTDAIGGKHVNLPLYHVENEDRVVHKQSGLNWGQRAGRESNQAYIPLPSDVRKSDFFPEYVSEGASARSFFAVITDDGFQMVMVRAQAKGKALHTPEDNSIIGKYFRRRLGVADGAPVYYSDLTKYGRDYVSLYKLDEETYYLDFSPIG